MANNDLGPSGSPETQAPARPPPREVELYALATGHTCKFGAEDAARPSDVVRKWAQGVLEDRAGYLFAEGAIVSDDSNRQWHFTIDTTQGLEVSLMPSAGFCSVDSWVGFRYKPLYMPDVGFALPPGTTLGEALRRKARA